MPHTLLYFIALFSLSTSPNWAKLSQMPVEVLGFYRLSIAAILVFFILIFTKKAWPKFDRNILWGILSGSLFFMHLWTYKFASQNTTVSNTMIIFSSNPIWTSLGAIVFFQEVFKKRLIVSYLLALGSIYLLVIHDFQLSNNYGDWSALLSALFYAAYMLTGKQARRYLDNRSFALIQYSICALLFALCVVATQANLTGYPNISWLSVAGLVVFPTLLGHFLFTYLVQYMNINLMACGKLIEPIIASILAYFIFREQLSQYAWISFVLTTFAVLILFAPALFSFVKKQFHIRIP